MPRSAAAVCAAWLLAVPRLGAQNPLTSAPTPVESLPAFARPNGALLRPGVLTYLLSLRRQDGQVVDLGRRTVTVVDTALGGSPVWLIAEARVGTVVETSDSVYVSRADLAPQRWSATMGRAQIGVSFSRDSMFGAVQSYQGRASFTLAVPDGTLLSAGMVERVAELLPLQLGYRASATLVLVDGSSPRALPVELVVDRAERALIGGRALDCWVLAIRAGPLELRLWISKDATRVVRSEQAVADGLLTQTLQP